MATKNIPGFYGGVSTQAPTLRLDSQVEAMENCITSLLKGTEKRPPASLFKVLSGASAITGTLSTAYVTNILKSDTEGYLLVVTDHATTPVNIFNLNTGVKATVTYVNDTTHYPYTYLISGTSSPRSKLKATTVEDYTFVCNNEVTVTNGGSETAAQDPLVIFHVKKGQVSTVYSATVTYTDQNVRNGVVTATYTSGAAEVDTTTIASGLAQALDTAFGGLASYPQFKIEVCESFIILTKNSWVTNTALVVTDVILAGTSEDGLGGTGISTISSENVVTPRPFGGAFPLTHTNFVGTVASFADLPGRLPKGAAVLWASSVSSNVTVDYTGYVIRIREETADSFGYYVKFSAATASWNETLIPYGSYDIAYRTLPVQIVKTGTDAFSVKYFSQNAGNTAYDIVSRTTGDDDTNPYPLFIGKTIQDVFFYKDRLGLLSDSTVFMSKTADYFNFFATTATDVLDDDPIELSASNTTTAAIILKDAAVWNEKLLINASGRQQLTLTSGGQVLSPKSASLDTITSFDLSTTCRPAGSGANVYYVESGILSSNIREFYLQDDGVTKDALNLSSHVEGYLPPDIKSIVLHPVRSVLAMLATTGDLYIYQYLQGAEGKAQSAFHKWTIADHTVYGVVLYAGSLFLLSYSAAGTTYILKIELERSATYGDVIMDFCQLTTGVYAAGTGLTTFTSSSPVTSATKIVSVTTGKELAVVTYGGYTMTVLGDYSTANGYVIGNPFSSFVTLSEPIYRDQQGVAQEDVELKLIRMFLSFRNTGYFKVTCVPRSGATFRKTISKEFWWFLVNLDSLTTVALKNSADMPFPFSCLLQTSARGATIQIVNDSYLPMELMNLSFVYNPKTQ